MLEQHAGIILQKETNFNDERKKYTSSCLNSKFGSGRIIVADKHNGSIEFVGTAPKFQGQGVASQIIQHIIENTPYNDYVIEEVADTNTPAMNLYKKLGFEKYKRKAIPQKVAKKI